jgi:hypothetical protein
MLTNRLSTILVGCHVWDDFAVAREEKHLTPIGTTRPSYEIRCRRPNAPRDRHATFRTPTTKVFPYG